MHISTDASHRHAVLMIHGLGGTRHDFGSLGKKLEDSGYDVFLPSLPGHGSTPDELNSVSLADYMQALERTYRELVGRYARVDVAGISMGALLALMLCARKRMTNGSLILLSPPLFLDGWAGSPLQPLRHLLYRIPVLRRLIRVPEREPFGIKNARIRNLIRRHLGKGSAVHYPYVPLAAIAQVDRMRVKVKNMLHRIACPTLVVHSEYDEVTSIRSAEFICEHIGTPDVTLVRLTDSYHMITLDNERDTVAAQTLEFVARRCADATARAAGASVPAGSV
ncbi:alpha/beta hydrolase [Paraburkholderia sp. J12]|uniref:alpha/beta hydrolase n=1 Tax=Paraburkholderia sp. J12 TaxID=2805432 RepID=UPI002ABD4828|nr:alpha/beta fold hydrolase [Paraburkholderia sp. J12]